MNPCHPVPLQETLHLWRSVWFSLRRGHCRLPLDPGAHSVLFVLSNVGSLLSPDLWKSCSQSPLAFKVRLTEDMYSVPLLDPQTGKPDVGSLRTFTTVGELPWILFSSFLWVAHTGTMGFYFIVIPPPPAFSLQFLLCLWTDGVFFCVCVHSRILLSIVVQQLVANSGISQMCTHASNVPS